MTIIKLPAEDDHEELTFFATGHHADHPNVPLTFLVRAQTTNDVCEGLASRGYISQTIEQATRPIEVGFRQRGDGTFLVTVYQGEKAIGVYGPFNHESDARQWIHQKTGSNDTPDLHYVPYEPMRCYRIGRINGTATILELPAHFFTSRL